MKRSRTIASAVILSATIVGSLLLAAPANAADVTFADPALQACANQWIGQAPTAPVSTTQAASLTALYCGNMGISDLGGVEAFANLDYLTLGSNSISDLTPIAGLTKLTNLTVENNQIDDISPLSALTNLSVLSISDNEISDIGTLSSLTKLTFLSMYSNQISDLSPIAPLTKISTLYIGGNTISDLSPLVGLAELARFSANDNLIADLTPLSGLLKLEGADLYSNEIVDLSPLVSLPVFNGITIQDNHIADLSPLGVLRANFGMLFQVDARNQTLTLPAVQAGESTTNPLVDPYGTTVTGVTGDANFALSADGDSWTYTSAASNIVSWSASSPGPMGWQFSGSIVQESLAVPVATTIVDDTATTVAGHAVAIDVLANDGLPSEPALVASTLTLLDADGNPASEVTVAGGTFEVVDGEIVFTPAAGFTGAVDDVDYQVTNADGVTGQATIRVTVTATVVPPTDPSTPATAGTPATTETVAGTNSGVLASTGTSAWPIVAFAAALFAAAGLLLLRRRA